MFHGPVLIYSGAKHPLEVSDTANEFPGVVWGPHEKKCVYEGGFIENLYTYMYYHI